MRRTRNLSAMGLLLAVLLPHLPLPAQAHAESSPPDSTATADSVATTNPTATPDSFLTIVPVKGAPFEAVYVAYWSMDSFRYRTAAGGTGYLTANKILAIEDAKGNDRLESMLQNRSSFGVPALDERRSFGAWVTRPFQATPERLRRKYLVVEFGIGTRADEVSSKREGGTLLITGIGGIKNLSSRWGVGGVAQFIQSSDDYRALSAGVRIRRYLSDAVTIETTQGLYQMINTDTRDEWGIPYFGELALSAAGVLSLFTRIEQHHYTTYRYSFPYYFYTLERFNLSDTTVHFGLRLGPRPGYLTGPLFALLSLWVLSPQGQEIY